MRRQGEAGRGRQKGKKGRRVGTPSFDCFSEIRMEFECVGDKATL